jgi:hypothetical protein
MRNTRTYTSATLSIQRFRFKRWSGNSWAVFSSIKRQIEIGFLSTAISTALGVKFRRSPVPDPTSVRGYAVGRGDEKKVLSGTAELSIPALLLIDAFLVWANIEATTTGGDGHKPGMTSRLIPPFAYLEFISFFYYLPLSRLRYNEIDRPFWGLLRTYDCRTPKINASP